MSRAVRILLVVGVLAVALGVPSAAAAKGRCGPARAHTVESNRYGRVYNYRQVVWGCAYSGGKPHALGTKYDCGSSSTCGGVNGVVLAGRWVGVTAYDSDGSTSVASVEVRRLRSGRTLRLFREGGFSSDGQRNTFALFGALVLKPNGSAGWLAAVRHSPRPPGEGPSTREVHRFDTRGRAVLDTGLEIKDLILHGSTMTWTNAGAQKSGTLN
jgi:hypothetical protein